jgi:hypothetical protein
MDSRRDELIHQLNEEGICSICQESVSVKSYIWSCNVCYQFFHLKCISYWALQKISDDRKVSDKAAWKCPWCQSFNFDIPHEYRVCLFLQSLFFFFLFLLVFLPETS